MWKNDKKKIINGERESYNTILFKENRYIIRTHKNLH